MVARLLVAPMLPLGLVSVSLTASIIVVTPPAALLLLPPVVMPPLLSLSAPVRAVTVTLTGKVSDPPAVPGIK